MAPNVMCSVLPGTVVTSVGDQTKLTRTQTTNANGSYDSYGVVTVDTTKSDNIHAIQVQIAPSEVRK